MDVAWSVTADTFCTLSFLTLVLSSTPSMDVGMVSSVTGAAAGGRGESRVQEYCSMEWYQWEFRLDMRNSWRI